MVAKTTAGLGWLEEPSINTWWWSNYLNKDFLFWLLEGDLLSSRESRSWLLDDLNSWLLGDYLDWLISPSPSQNISEFLKS
jgi:hypothetical protein